MKNLVLLFAGFFTGLIPAVAQDYVLGALLLRYSAERAKVSAQQQTVFLSEEPAYPFLSSGRFKQQLAAPEWELVRRTRLVQVDPAIQIPQLAAKLARMPGIELAEPVWISESAAIPDDPSYVNQTQNYFALIGAAQAWAIASGSSSVVIAITDTGVDYLHPDLAANLWKNPGESGNGKETNGLDDDGNGFVDDVNGWDFADNDNTPLPVSNNHGTHVAGIAAAVTGNGVGIASLSYNVKFLPIRAGASSIPFGYQSIAYAAALGVPIINCSWGATRYTQSGWEVVKAATASGSLIIGAAGNEGTQRIYFPAGFPEALSVGAIQNTKAEKASFSNYNFTVDLSAPGVDVYSTLAGNTYGMSGGTSMAAPMVSALAALVRSNNPTWSMDQVRANIVASTKPITPISAVRDAQLGPGFLWAPDALSGEKSNLTLTRFQFTDSTSSNFDRIFDAGEPLEIQFSVKNYGQAATYSLGLSASTNQLTVITSSLSTGLLQPNEEKTFSGVRVNVSPTATPDAQPVLYLDATSGGLTKRMTLQTLVKPSYGTIDGNSIELTLAGNGRLGWINPASNTSEGSPFLLRTEGTTAVPFNTPLLADGSLIIARQQSGTPVSDAARGPGSTVTYNSDFVIVRRSFTERSTPDFNVGEVEFADAATPTGLGIAVKASMSAFTGTADDRSIILKYTVSTLNNTLTDARIGLYLDFDLPVSAPSNDKVYYDAANDLLYQVDQEVSGQESFFVGAAVYGGAGSVWPILNSSTASGVNFGVNDGFTDEEKRGSMFWGKVEPITDEVKGPGDVSFTIAGRTFSLAANSSHTDHFILTYGNSKAELLANIAAARLRIDNGIPARSEEDRAIPEFGISAVFPNPFNPETRIQLSGGGTPVTVQLFDVSGRLIQTLLKNRLITAETTLRVDGSLLPSGVYLVKMTSLDGKSDVRKITLIR